MAVKFLQQIARCATVLGLTLATLAFAADDQPTTPGKELESLRQEILRS